MKDILEVILNEYKIDPLRKVDHEEVKRIDDKLKEINKYDYRIEDLPKRILLLQKALYTYPKLSTEFLSLHNEFEYGGEIINIPKFGVFTRNKSKISIDFGYSSENSKFMVLISPSFPKIIEKPLAKSIEFLKDEFGIEYSHFSGYSLINRPTKEIAKKYKRIGGININYNFQGFIPSDIKDRITDTSEMFLDGVFIIKEIQPHEWNAKEVVIKGIDPIICGVIEDTAFYIDKFNTTPLEEIIKTGFSQLN